MQLNRIAAGDAYQASSITGGLSRGQFQANVLRHRDAYRGIVVFEATIPWSVILFQRPQQMALAFAQAGFLVLYASEGIHGDSGLNGYHQVKPGLWVTIDIAGVIDIKESIRITYSTSSHFHPRRTELKQVLVYEYVDVIDEAISGDVTLLLAKKAKAFGGEVDLVVATSSKLLDEVKSSTKTPCFLSNNGVPSSKIVDSTLAPRIDPGLRSFQDKFSVVVGYVGAIAPWLWFALIEMVCADNPDIGFIFVGPLYDVPEQILPRGENILTIGPVEYDRIIEFLPHFDVGWIPFQLGEIAQTTSPLKLFEYFGAGLPTLVTPDMTECLKYPGLTFEFSCSDTFRSALKSALLEKKGPEWRTKAKAVSAENTWDTRVENYVLEMSKVFDKKASGEAPE